MEPERGPVSTTALEKGIWGSRLVWGLMLQPQRIKFVQLLGSEVLVRGSGMALNTGIHSRNRMPYKPEEFHYCS